MLQAGQFGDPHLVAVRFQEQTAQHIGQMRAEFAALDGMAPQLRHAALGAFQAPRHFRLAARHQRDIFGLMLQGEQDRLIRRRVAGMQRGDDIDRPDLGLGDPAFDKIHAREAAVGGDLPGRGNQVGARFHRQHPATACGREIQVIENKPQIGFARPQIGQHGLGLFRQRRVDGGPDQLRQMLHLLELAPGIRVQPAIMSQDMQRLEQRHRLAGPQFRQGIGFFGLFRGFRTAMAAL